MVAKIPSLESLPISGITDTGQRVKEVKRKLEATQIMLNQIYAYPQGLPAILSREMQNVNFHIKSGLSCINTFIGAGHTWEADMPECPGLLEAVQLHVGALSKAKMAWRTWIASEKAEGRGKSLPDLAPKSTALVQSKQVQHPDLLAKMGQPTPFKRYMGVAVAGGIGLLLWWAMS